MTNADFGFNFPWWDWLFGTYRPQPAAGHTGMAIGLARYRRPELLTLPRLLVLPFTAIRAAIPSDISAATRSREQKQGQGGIAEQLRRDRAGQRTGKYFRPDGYAAGRHTDSSAEMPGRHAINRRLCGGKTAFCRAVAGRLAGNNA
ncbi:MAG: hypothetical protein C4531_05250 [Desulfurivibrio sp.]|nr:MAG: hypothetical protein C4531_05250 [Desulfurivibrio sp.]